MNKFFKLADIDSPKVNINWIHSTERERFSKIYTILKRHNIEVNFSIIEARVDGQVIIELKNLLGPDLRGTLLLDLEEFLKKELDPGITIWLNPLGDKNSLRNLRGIEVKS